MKLHIACAVVGFLSLVLSLQAQTLTTLYSFCAQSNCTDGEHPQAALVQATDGNLYGTTAGGGGFGNGSFFKITPTGSLTPLYSFTGPDGADPTAALVQATDGNFYGTTQGGGSDGYGTVFKMTASGVLTKLHSFDGSDGYLPVAGLIQATDGNFYGTTYYGGANCGSQGGCGTVFKITPSGTLTTLYSFCSQSGCTDGEFPYAGLIQATNGDFYGTTFDGGGSSGDHGTVFEITPSGSLTTLHSFAGTDGLYPLAGLVQANGVFYGSTDIGGIDNAGTVFAMTASGVLTTLHNFYGPDGNWPYGTLVQATDGNLYGTTMEGGTKAFGTAFKITPEGTLTTLYNFCSQTNCTDGLFPEAALFQATNGTLYGTTNGGGAHDPCGGGCGTVFSLSVGLGPFVSLEPDSGWFQKTIGILGQGFTGTTSVSFNGAAAKFNVVSDTYLTASVPLPASTGPVTVVTPTGTLTSNQPFRVLVSAIAHP